MADLNAKRKFCADPPPAASSAAGPGRTFGGPLLLSLAVCAALTAGAAAQTAPSYTIHTVAGGVLGEDGVPAVQARISPQCVTADAAGNLYFGSKDRIRKVDAATGILSTVAGNGEKALPAPWLFIPPSSFNIQYGNPYVQAPKVHALNGGDGVPATAVRLQSECPVFDAAGNLYFGSDSRIRKVDAATGIISTVAGSGMHLHVGVGGDAHYLNIRSKDGIPATEANLYQQSTQAFLLGGQRSFNNQIPLASDAAGNLYFIEFNNVRKVDAATGILSTVAGSKNGTPGYSGDGGPAVAAQLRFPKGVALDAAGNLYIADTSNRRIRRVDAATGIISTVAGNGEVLRDHSLREDGRPAIEATINHPIGISVDAAGNLFILSRIHGGLDSMRFIQKVDAVTGAISTVTWGYGLGPLCIYGEDGVPAAESRVCLPSSISVDAAGNLYIAEFGNHRIRKVDAATGIISTVAGNGEDTFGGLGGRRAEREAPELTATEATFWNPRGVAVDAAGNLHINDDDVPVTSIRIRKVDAATGIVTTSGDNPWYDSFRPGRLATAADGSIYYSYPGYNFGGVWRLDGKGRGSLVTGEGWGYSGDGGPATEAHVFRPMGLAVDSSGNLFIADHRNHRIRKVDAATGIISTVVGNVDPNWDRNGGYSGDGGPATEAQIYCPTDVAVDSSDNLYIADMCNSRIRRVDAATGIISTVAGTGSRRRLEVDAATGIVSRGVTGDGGPAQAAAIGYPIGIAVDAAGNLFISEWSYVLPRYFVVSAFHYRYLDRQNDAFYSIRMVDAVTGNISTVAGGRGPGYSGDGGPATEAHLDEPIGLAADSWGNVYIADAGNRRIRRLTPRQSGNAGNAPAVSSNGFALATGTPVVGRIAPNALISVFGQEFAAAGTRAPSPILRAGRVAGNLADTCLEIGGSGARAPLFYVSPTQINAQAPSGLPSVSGRTQARVVRNCGKSNELPGATAMVEVAAVSPALFNLGGNADGRNPLVALHGGGPALVGPPELGAAFTPAEPGEIVTLFGTGFGPTEPALAAGRISGMQAPLAGGVSFHFGGVGESESQSLIETVAGGGRSLGDGGPATEAQLLGPWGVAPDGAGNLYIADSSNNRIRKVDAAGVITTVAGSGERGYSGDGGAATAAQLSLPVGVALDAAGNLYIADRNNDRIRKVDAAGAISTVAGGGRRGYRGYGGDGGPAVEAQLDRPSGVALDAAGNLYIADTDNQRIRKVDAAGVITTVAGDGNYGYGGDGGPAVEAHLRVPRGVALDGAGNLYIADSSNDRIRKVDAAGVISTVAGDGPNSYGGDGYGGDGGAATAAQLSSPWGVAPDGAGNLYIADTGNQRIRKVDAGGLITTVAGTGVRGYSGDGGAAVAAQLRNPRGVAVDGAGNLYIADENHRIRRVEAQQLFTPLYAGAAPCCAGLYQFTVRLPDNLPDGNVPVTAAVQGVSTPSGPFLTIQRR